MGLIYNYLVAHASASSCKAFCIVDDGRRLSFGEAKLVVDRLADLILQKLGPHPAVAVQIQDPLVTRLIALAVNKISGSVVPLSLDLLPHQVEGFLNASRVTCLISDKRDVNTISSGGFNVTTLTGYEIQETLARTKEKCSNENNIGYRLKQPYLITFSSGSTGDPKPLIFTEANKILRAQQAIELFSLTNEDIVLNASPFYHSLGQRLTYLPLILGATSVLISNFNSEAWIQAVEKNHVTFTIPVSSHLHDLVEYIENDELRCSSLRAIVSSSAGISFDTKKRLMSLRKIEFHEMYGASEVATISNLTPTRLDKIDSVGLPVDGVDVQIWDDENKPVVNGVVGEICAKTQLSSPGYLNRQDLTQKNFHNKFFKTGDLGYIDEDGFLYFVGRKKDIIISGGVNIYPSDIEPIISAHQDVRSCCVIGIKDNYFGEVVVAVIETRSSDHKAIEKELRRLARSSLAKNQRPIKYVFQNELPLLPSGKLDKLLLVSMVEAMNLGLGSMVLALQRNVNK